MLRKMLFGVALAIVSGFSDPTLGFDGVLHVQYGEALYAVNADGSTKWIFGTGDSSWLHAEGLNGTVYVATVGPYDEPWTGKCATANLFALDSSDGSIQWEYQFTEHRYVLETIEHPLVVTTDGTVYITSRNSRNFTDTTIDAIDAQGALKWTATIAGNQARLSAVGDDGTVFVTSRQSLVALGPETGTVRWSLKFHGNRELNVIAEDGNVFLMELDPYSSQLLLARLSNEDGSSLWTIPLFALHFPQLELVRSMTLGINKELYINGLAKNGTCSLGVFDFDGNTLRSLPCLSNSLRSGEYELSYGDAGDMFVTASSDKVWALSGADGHEMWNVSVPDEFPLSGEANFARDGTVFVWTDSFYSDFTQCHAIRNGEVAWSVQTGDASQQIMSEDGTTYVQGWFWDFIPSSRDRLVIVAVGADGAEKWRYTPAEAAAELV